MSPEVGNNVNGHPVQMTSMALNFFNLTFSSLERTAIVASIYATSDPARVTMTL